MHATSTRPLETKRQIMPPAARMRSLGASFGTINSPLKRYTPPTVDDGNANSWYYAVQFAKISLSIGYDNARRHDSIGVAPHDLSSRRHWRRNRQRDSGRGDLCDVSDVVGDRRVSVDGERHHDGRRGAELLGWDSRLPISTSRSSRPDPIADRSEERRGGKECRSRLSP